MTDEEQKAYLQEVDLVIAEIDQLFDNWAKRSADPLVAMSVMLVKASAFSGELFDNDKDYIRFVRKCVLQGVETYAAILEEEKNEGSDYVH